MVNTLPNLRKAMALYYQIHKPAIKFSFENCSEENEKAFMEDFKRNELYEANVLRRLQDALLLDTSEINSEENVRLIDFNGLEQMIPEEV